VIARAVDEPLDWREALEQALGREAYEITYEPGDPSVGAPAHTTAEGSGHVTTVWRGDDGSEAVPPLHACEVSVWQDGWSPEVVVHARAELDEYLCRRVSAGWEHTARWRYCAVQR